MHTLYADANNKLMQSFIKYASSFPVVTEEDGRGIKDIPLMNNLAVRKQKKQK
jgi:hypothetical protein